MLLLQGCKKKDRLAQRDMVDYLAPLLWGTCRRYESDQTQIQDLVQDALVLIFQHIHECNDHVASFIAWSKKITINVCLEKYRKKKIRLEYVIDYPEVTDTSSTLESEIDTEAMLLALDQLPDTAKMVFNLYIMEGYSHKEIGQALGIQESSSRALLNRAKAMLKTIFQKKEMTQNEYGSF